MTTPNQSINQFIEANIDEIDNQEYDYIFNEAYIAFDNIDYTDFVEIMRKIGVDTLPYQKEVLKDKMQQELEYWSQAFPHSEYINVSLLSRDYLINECGLSYQEFRDFALATNWEGFYIDTEYNIYRKEN